MTSPHTFLMEFMKELVHVKNVDTRPQIVQQWTEKLEAREAAILNSGWPTAYFDYEGNSYKFPFKLGYDAGLTISSKGEPPLLGGYSEEEIIHAIKSGKLKPIEAAGME